MRRALDYAKKLEGAGFTKRQVEVSYEILDKTLNKLATREDMVSLRTEFKKDMAHLKVEFKKDISDLRKDMQYGFKLMESKLTIRLGLMIFACFSVMKVFDKFFDKFF